jgi:prepilin-type N-terminal cleavage/methylation domain-containing protein
MVASVQSGGENMVQNKQKGFTMIELMIVVAIIGILAAIALPKFADMIEKSREGSTKGNVGALKSANAIYYGDMQGVWPTTINTVSTYKYSLYLDIIPQVKVTGKFDANTGTKSPVGARVSLLAGSAVPNAPVSGWAYDSTNGLSYVNSTLQDSKKVAYSFYGFE